MIETIKLNQQECEKLLKIIEAHSEPSSQLLGAVEKYREHLCDTVTIPRDKLEAIKEVLDDYKEIHIPGAIIRSGAIRFAINTIDKYLNQKPRTFMDQADEALETIEFNERMKMK